MILSIVCVWHMTSRQHKLEPQLHASKAKLKETTLDL